MEGKGLDGKCAAVESVAQEKGFEMASGLHNLNRRKERQTWTNGK